MSESDTMFNERDRRCAAVQLMFSTDPSYDNRTIASTLKMQIWIATNNRDVPRVMKTKFPATVIVFGVVSSEGHIMPPHIIVVITWIGREHELYSGASPIWLVEHCVTFRHDRRLLSLLGFVLNWQTSRWSATKKIKLVFIKRKWNHVFSWATILSFHPVEGSYRCWDLYSTGQLVDGLQQKKKKKINKTGFH